MRISELDALIARFGRTATLETVVATLAREAAEAARTVRPSGIVDSDRPGPVRPMPAVAVVRKSTGPDA
jgi:hypothetical protein